MNDDDNDMIITYQGVSFQPCQLIRSLSGREGFEGFPILGVLIVKSIFGA